MFAGPFWSFVGPILALSGLILVGFGPLLVVRELEVAVCQAAPPTARRPLPVLSGEVMPSRGGHEVRLSSSSLGV